MTRIKTEPKFHSGDKIEFIYSSRPGTISSGEYSRSWKAWKFFVVWDDGHTPEWIRECNLAKR